MNAYFVICLTAILSLSTAMPQRQPNYHHSIPVNNRKLSNANEINTLDSSQQLNTVTGLGEIGAKLREVADKLDILISTQIANTQQTQLKDPIPFKAGNPQFESNKDYISTVSDASAKKTDKIATGWLTDEIPKVVDIPGKNNGRLSTKRHDIYTTTPSTISNVLERPYVESTTQPMFRVSDKVIGMNFGGDRGDVGVISGQY